MSKGDTLDNCSLVGEVSPSHIIRSRDFCPDSTFRLGEGIAQDPRGIRGVGEELLGPKFENKMKLSTVPQRQK